MTDAASATSYDDVPYEGGVIVGSHPQHLAMLGKLLGMDPAPVEHARVLEVGCASADNLVPMAYSLPYATFVGIDLSERQVEMGRAALAEYGVTNVELVAGDFGTDRDWGGEFDYIICHGVFTWVPQEVQDAILRQCRRLLAPQGLAYISYNALPGFHMRAGVGEMLRFHANHFSDPQERIDQSYALLDFLTESTASYALNDHGLGVHHQILKGERELLRAAARGYLMHEHLDDSSTAFYLHEFVELAAAHGLQYVGDAAFHTMMTSDLAPEVAAKLNAIASNQIQLEQYRDFVLNRMFRKSILCRDTAELVRHISAEAIASLSFRHVLPRRESAEWRIPTVDGRVVRATNPDIEAALETLEAALPEALSFGELSARIAQTKQLEPATLAAVLHSLLALDAVEFRTSTPRVETRAGERPRAFVPALRAAARGASEIPVPFHTTVRPGKFAVRLLSLLDGSRTRADIERAMRQLLERGEFTLPEPHALAGAPALSESVRLAAAIEDALDELRREGLFI